MFLTNLYFFIPSHLSDIRKLEKTLIAHRIRFPKVLIPPKGEFPKLQRAICNIPIKSLNNVCNVLPRGADNSGIINIELKRKLSYNNPVIAQQVRHQNDIKVLNYLFQNNHLYSHVEIDDSNISCNEENIDFVIDDIDEKSYITFIDPFEKEKKEMNMNNNDNRLSLYRSNVNETVMISKLQIFI